MLMNVPPVLLLILLPVGLLAALSAGYWLLRRRS